ncbi:MAG TPA: hypothetical protein VKV80_16125 [Streptosporangiaceae bacterium]|jgi:hypothetical protein|nr:hypothetical protein [Streptosporangiaceae bacterium]
MAREIGRGGITLVAVATSTAADTVGRGAAELEEGIVPDGRVRRAGAGRTPVTETGPEILGALDELVDGGSRGIRCGRCGGRPSRRSAWLMSWRRAGTRAGRAPSRGY